VRRDILVPNSLRFKSRVEGERTLHTEGRPREFSEIGRLPAPGDNVAIATERLEARTEVERADSRFKITHTVLEGHRFAVEPIAEGENLLSWGLPFGRAVKDIAPGDYVCNEKILRVLRERHPISPRRDGEEPDGTHDQGPGRIPGGFRHLHFVVPGEPNFRDAELTAYELDEERFRPGKPVPLYDEPRTFMGYRRPGSRGVGTRNHVLVLGVTSRTNSYAKSLEVRLRALADGYENVDGIVAVAHTEGGEGRTPNNLEILLRTLSGFAVHPNVGAVLVIDEDEGAVTGRMLHSFMEEHGYPIGDVPHRFMSLGRSFRLDLEKGEDIVRAWLPEVDAARRAPEPLSGLKLALQCGGSDAFSGVSANPLIGWVAKEVIKNGGAAILAETDELIGAEPYVLSNVKDLETAKRFLSTIERFKELVGWHGHTAEGNPSGGNNYRGLYNISIKSIGAAAKRDPEVRIEHVIEYAERMREDGFHFMDSPGNDLESVAGEVASGCNLIFFTTGNGSITNFPFVPTIKVVSTTGRYNLLPNEMDVNAGAYLDGVPMEVLGRETLELAVRSASGERTVGEKAGHSQAQIWRDWKQTSTANLERILSTPAPDGEPLPLKTRSPGAAGGHAFEAVETERGYATDQVGLVMPTNLCSSQIALKIADSLNERGYGEGKVSRFVALPHTEGCGNSGGASLDLYDRTVLGHLDHPLVRFALLLEHGCEKTHNDYFRARLLEADLDPECFGWASVQLDGGIEKVTRRVEDWFAAELEAAEELQYETAGLKHLRLGLMAASPVPDEVARSLAELTAVVVGAGGTVVVPKTAPLLRSRVYLEGTVGDGEVRNTLAHGQAARKPGFHVMEAPTNDPTETATGLGATGVEVMLAHVSSRPLQAHRMIPLLQVCADPETAKERGEDLDVILDGDPSSWTENLLGPVLDVASRRYTPRHYGQGNTGFQLTRGLLGVSM
jgi:altronate dehydratase